MTTIKWLNWLTMPINLHVIAAVDKNVEAVRQLMLDRSITGIAKYGTTTERDDIDLAGWHQHHLEELCDAAVYVTAAKALAAKDKAKRCRDDMELATHARAILQILEQRSK